MPKLSNDPFSVSVYLDLLNEIIAVAPARVIGEVGQFTKRGNALYFSIRDKEDKTVLGCFMWLSDYKLSNIELEEGMEVIVDGVPEIYKPTGRLSLRARTIELVGEGELKKAYDKLKAKLEAEGFFDDSAKKQVKLYPRKIGLITSREGAVIHDFLNNLAKRGYEISFINSRVEGARAVLDLISAMGYFRRKEIDVLVVIRGGGSLESFIPFNNELVIREMKNLPFPVIAGIGHDKDVPLFSLAADIMTSTPTATTAVLNSSWKEAEYSLGLYKHNLISGLREIKNRAANEMRQLSSKIREYYKDSINEVKRFIVMAENVIKHNDPERQLKLGYSIARSNGKVL